MVKVDKNKCIGCGTCPTVCPKVFEMGPDGKARVKKDADKKSPCIKKAISACPVNAISE